MRKFTIVVLSLLISANVVSQTDVKDTYNVLVDNTGNISLPKEYRQNWTFLGSYFVQSAPTPTGETSHDMHTVYTQPYAVTHYRKHGNFPDGAVLIKEVNATKTEPLTTGLASYQDAPKVIFAMVKDTKSRFAGNAAWDEGWGWALFNPGDPKSQTTTWKGEGLNNCFGCHIPVKANDWVSTQGYKSVLGK